MRMIDCNIDYEKLSTGGWCLDHNQESWKCKEKVELSKGWIGIDFDGTLSTYDTWRGEFEFGEPIPSMVDFIHKLLGQGYEVKIFTARVSEDEIRDKMVTAIQKWLVYKAGLPPLEVTNIKDYAMVELYDDRAVTVEKNTGKFLAPSSRARGLV